MIVTGIGSRYTPEDVLQRIDRLAIRFARAGWLLRSGGADGADLAFETGFIVGNGAMEIYLPWRKFNGNQSLLYTVSDEALEMASEIHPAWSKCGRGARLLHGRNCYQILGRNLNRPSDVVVCWTKGGKLVGGTRTALVLAEKHDIPIINLATFNDDDKIIEFLEKSSERRK